MNAKNHPGLTARIGHYLDPLIRAVTHVPGRVIAGMAAVAALYLLYCVVTHRRVRGSLRRLGICAVVAAVLSAAGVGWVDHSRHDNLVANSLTGVPMAVPKILLYVWGFGFLTGTAALLALGALWVRFRPRRLGRRPRRGGRGRPVDLPYGGGIPYRGGMMPPHRVPGVGPDGGWDL